MHLALWQCLPIALDTAGNLQRLREAATRAKAQGAELLVTPEMFLTGYNIGLAAVQQLAEPRDGPLAQAVSALAQELAIGVLYGYPERDAQGRFYNAVQLFDDHGQALAHYRKTHLFGELDRRLFSAGGDHFPVVAYKGLLLGLLICYDLEFPETARRLALAGTQAILVPTANMQPFEFIAQVTVRSRAFENQCYVAYANYCGHEGPLAYCGLSSIVGPGGEVLAHAAATPDLLLARLDHEALGRARLANHYLSDRQPGLYRSLTDGN